MSRFKGSLLSLTEVGKKKKSKTIDALGNKMKIMGYPDDHVETMVQTMHGGNKCNHSWLPTGTTGRYHRGTGKFMGHVETQKCSNPDCGKVRHINPETGKVVAVYEDKEILKEVKKMSAKEFVNILRSDDFGKTEAGGNGEAILSKGKIIVRDSYWVGGDAALNKMVKSWSPGGHNYEYFKKEYDVKTKVVGKDNFLRGGKMYGKKQKDGVVQVELRLI